MPFDFECVVQRFELCPRADVVDDGIDSALVCVVDGDIFHGPTFEAYQVVMMTMKPFGELIAGQALGPVVRHEHTGVL